MSKSWCGNKLSVLHAVLTVVAALAILVLSVTPAFSFDSLAPDNSGLFLYIVAGVFLFFLLVVRLLFAGTQKSYTLGRRGGVSVMHAVLTAAAALIILAMSAMAPQALDAGTPANSGILLHVIAYGTLCFLTGMWLCVEGATQFPVLGAFFLSSFFGLLIECVQLALPYRSFEMVDIITNCLAAAIALVPCSVAIRYAPLYKKISLGS